jgi:hypothetical protein
MLPHIKFFVIVDLTAPAQHGSFVSGGIFPIIFHPYIARKYIMVSLSK